MALWKISVKTTGTVNGVRLEKSMFIEMPTNGQNPLQAVSAHESQISMLFQNKYGIDLLKANLVNAYNPHPGICAEWGLQLLGRNDGVTRDGEN